MKRILVIIMAVTMLFSTACSKEVNEWQAQYDLGMRYLSEGNYKEAIIAFNAVIEIDDKYIDAYIGLADAYAYKGDLEMAEKVLKDAMEITGDTETLSKKLEEIFMPRPKKGYPKTVEGEAMYTSEKAKRVSEFNEYGFLIKQTDINAETGRLLRKISWDFDEMGRCIGHIDEDNTKVVFTYAYNEGSNSVEIKISAEWGDIIGEKTFSYEMHEESEYVIVHGWGISSINGIASPRIGHLIEYNKYRKQAYDVRFDREGNIESVEKC